MSDTYTIESLKHLVSGLTDVFDIIRIIDPVNRKIVLFDSHNNIIYDEYSCYQFWNKHSPCENCISMKASKSQCRLTKYDFVNNDVYHLVSKYVELSDKEGVVHGVVIEMISKITEEFMLGSFGKGEVVNHLVEAEKKVYIDSLTKVYNRKYFDERRFCRQLESEFSSHVTFILVDLKQFKSINDNYGHHVGDWVLTTVGQTLLRCVRNCDSVIRLGGDEFLIILQNSSEEASNRIICDIKKLLQQNAVYDETNHKYAQGNFGIAYTESFDNTDECIRNLLIQADVSMYKDKNTN